MKIMSHLYSFLRLVKSPESLPRSSTVGATRRKRTSIHYSLAVRGLIWHNNEHKPRAECLKSQWHKSPYKWSLSPSPSSSLFWCSSFWLFSRNTRKSMTLKTKKLPILRPESLKLTSKSNQLRWRRKSCSKAACFLKHMLFGTFLEPVILALSWNARESTQKATHRSGMNLKLTLKHLFRQRQWLGSKWGRFCATQMTASISMKMRLIRSAKKQPSPDEQHL